MQMLKRFLILLKIRLVKDTVKAFQMFTFIALLSTLSMSCEDPEKENLKQERDELRYERDELEEKNERIKREKDELEEEKEQLEEERDQLEQEKEELEEELDDEY